MPAHMFTFIAGHVGQIICLQIIPKVGAATAGVRGAAQDHPAAGLSYQTRPRAVRAAVLSLRCNTDIVQTHTNPRRKELHW